MAHITEPKIVYRYVSGVVWSGLCVGYLIMCAGFLTCLLGKVDAFFRTSFLLYISCCVTNAIVRQDLQGRKEAAAVGLGFDIQEDAQWLEQIHGVQGRV